MLQQIEEKLKTVCKSVYYGVADSIGNIPPWNYIVFRRDRTARTATNKGFSEFYVVAIIHENWVPDEMIRATISEMESLPGMRLASSDIQFEYTSKPGTNVVVEVAAIQFVRPWKRVE